MSSSLRDATPEEFVKAVDPSLEFVDCLQGSPRFNLVYKVRRGDNFYVLKGIWGVCGDSYFLFERNSLRTEKQKEPAFRPVMNALSSPASLSSQNAGL